MNYLEIASSLNNTTVENTDKIFEIARSIAQYYQHPDTNADDGRDLIIRLIDRRAEFDQKLPGIGRMIDAIAREAGLHPYMEDLKNWRDRAAFDLMKSSGEKGIVFHIEQAAIFTKLYEGRSIILSAPTSFGKSLLIDALIASRKPQVVVAVVPTIALLDEFRRRMMKKFVDYQIISTALEATQQKKRIYIGTQERLLQREDIKRVDLFVIDEFYKLDFDRGDERSLALNAILSRYGRTAKQLYFLGPSIDSVPNSSNFRKDIEFIKKNFSPVAADIIDRTGGAPTPDKLIYDLKSVKNESSLVYVRSPRAAHLMSYSLMNENLFASSDFCNNLGDWLAENFHPEWALAKSIKLGIGIHHGRIPRSVAQLLISLFNLEEIKIIICTSSMIEGINTAAQNVFIYDRHISTHKLDRFTYNNIKGRAGRMFKHKIGRVFIYNQPPEMLKFDVNVPIFDDQIRMSPELLVQIDDESLTPDARSRKQSIAATSFLPQSILRMWAEYGITGLNNLAEELRFRLKSDGVNLIWSGYPNFQKVNAVFDVVWDRIKFNKHDIRSARQAAFFASVLRKEDSIRKYMERLVKGEGSFAQLDIDRCFNFLRGAEHTFPQIFRATNDIIDFIIGEGAADYRLYAQQFQNCFMFNEGRYLDEYGIPMPIAAKLVLPRESDSRSLLNALQDRSSGLRSRLNDFEQELLSRSIK